MHTRPGTHANSHVAKIKPDQFSSVPAFCGRLHRYAVKVAFCVETMNSPGPFHDHTGIRHATEHPELGQKFLELVASFPKNTAAAVFAMGCFWGPEKMFRHLNGVHGTMTGYAGGNSFHANYKSVCTGRTGHCEIVAVAYDPATISYENLLEHFWTEHDPTQGMKQGNDIGTQYRSAVFFLDDEQKNAAERTRNDYQVALYRSGRRAITTELVPLEMFFPAEEYHQQYLAGNPLGHCGTGGTGVPFPINR